MKPTFVSLLLCLLLLSGCSITDEEGGQETLLPAARIVLTGGTLIDGTGAEPIENATVVIAGERIQEVFTGDARRYESEPDTQMIDVEGKFLLPGLIDGHVHYLGWAGPLYVSHGVTSVLDLGNWTPWILAQRYAVANDLVPGPRIFTAAGQIDSPPGTFPHSVNAATEEEARELVRKHAERGVDYIKAYTMIRPELLEAIIEEARDANLVVRGHITVSARDAALFGIASLEHMSGIAIATIDDPDVLREVEEKRTDSAYVMATVRELAPLMNPGLFDDLIELMVSQETALSPTLVSWWMGVHPHTREYEEQDRSFLDDPRLSFIPEVSRQSIVGRYARSLRERSDPKFELGYTKSQEFIRAFLNAGGTVLASSDTTLGAMPGMDLHRELELLVESGLSPLQALQAATRNPARLIGQDHNLGTIEPGKLADLIVIGGDPLEDIRNTRKIETVIKAGKMVEIGYDSPFLDMIPRPVTADYLSRFNTDEP